MLTNANITATIYEFPEDAKAAQEALLAAVTGVERWWRCYAFTYRPLAEAIIAANKTAPQHLYVDKSQTEDAEQRSLVMECVEAGVEVTIGTSPEGQGFIAHSKAFAGADGDIWEGSLNWSESAWRQVNTALTYNSPARRDELVAAFKRDVAYAWSQEQSCQVMSSPPAWLT